MAATAYAASFEIAPGRTCWLLVHQNGDRLRRVDVVSDWLVARASARDSPNTLKSMAESVAIWWTWAHDSGIDPMNTDAVAFARFVVALQSVPKGLPITSQVRALAGDHRLRSPGTVALRCVHITSFYKWALANGRVNMITGRSIGGFKKPRSRQARTPDRLLPDQVARLLASEQHPREGFAVELMYGTGLREGEALGLWSEDLCTSPAVAEVFGCQVPGGSHVHVTPRSTTNGARAKSGTSRVVPLTSRVLHAYRDWQAWLYDQMPEALENPYVFVSLAGTTRGQPLSISGFNSRWRKRVREVLGTKVVRPHLLRHTFASELADAGVEAFVIQELLGHSSPASTQVYTHALMASMSDAVGRLSVWRSEGLVVAP